MKTSIGVLILALCAGCTMAAPYRGAHFGDVMGSPSASRAGMIAFAADRIDQSKGPFNEISCANCHGVPSLGGTQTDWHDFVILTNVAGHPMPYPRYTVVHGMVKIRPLPGWYFLRRPQPLYGIGLLQAVPVSELRRVAAEEPARQRGRLAVLPNGSVGRFGWKGDVPTARQFVETAFAGETGVPHAKDIPAVTSYLMHLAPPPRGAQHADREGQALFGQIGCAECHRPTLRIGSFAPMPALDGRLIDPYSDELLHDMGRAEADVPRGAAGASEFVTAPLWGVARIGPPYMHDGRATSLQQAIVSHGGQAADSVRNDRALTAQERAALLRFLQSL